MKTPVKRPARVISKPVVRKRRVSAARPKPALSAACRAVLQEVVVFARAQADVAIMWACKTKLTRPMRVSVLLTGENPASARLAAQTLAQDLKLELRCIDLSSVVSQYIGETEKNLRGILAAAKKAGVVLFFDEADALFGKRTGVKDSHDRYANQEVSYLLERIEEFSGVAILSTNRRASLDSAFTRRFQFVIPIPPKKSRLAAAT